MKVRNHKAPHWVYWFAGISTATFAPLAIPLFSIVAVANRKLGPWPKWIQVWIPALVPIAVLEAATRHFASAASWFGESTLAVAMGALLVGCRASIGRALQAGLVLVAVLLVIGQTSVGNLWYQGANSNTLPQLASLLTTGIQEVSHVASRQWDLPAGTQRAAFDAQIKSVGGPGPWYWLPHGETTVHSLAGNGATAARLTFGSNDNPYAQKWVRLRAPVAGRLFRVRLDMRSPETIEGEGCRGIRLQAFGKGGDASCSADAIDPTWRTYTAKWRAPRSAESDVIRVVLNGFREQTVDVRHVHLFVASDHGWTELSPLQTAAATVFLGPANGNSGGATTISDLTPTPGWQHVHLEVPVNPSRRPLPALVRLTPATKGRLLIRGDVLHTDISTPTQLVYPVRQSLWFGQPNLAGHAIAASAMAALALAGGTPAMLLTIFSGIVALYLTGSRTALVAFVLGSLLVMVLRSSWHRRTILTAMAAISLVVVLSVALSLVPQAKRWAALLTYNDGQATPRTEIWAGSLGAFLRHPALGLVGAHETFTSYWDAQHKGEPHEQIRHAHNFWLEFASLYGVIGLLCSIWLSLQLLHLGWRRGRGVGVTLVGTILFMNVFDYTLFYSGVLLPIILAINALNVRDSHDFKTLDGG